MGELRPREEKGLPRRLPVSQVRQEQEPQFLGKQHGSLRPSQSRGVSDTLTLSSGADK